MVGIAHDADMRAAVAQPDQRVGRGDHLAHHVEIARGEVGDGQVQHLAAVALEQQVVATSSAPSFARARAALLAPGRARSPADRRTETCGPTGRPALAPAALERLLLECGLGIQGLRKLGQALRERQVGDRLVRRPAHERVSATARSPAARWSAASAPGR
jgi:hypothetical protein